MKKFNLNNYVFVQITEYGWEKLKETVGNDYIQHCILSKEIIIFGEKWYKLQGHQMITLFGKMLFIASHSPINCNIMFEDEVYLREMN